MRIALGIEYDGTDYLGWQRLVVSWVDPSELGSQLVGGLTSELAEVRAHELAHGGLRLCGVEDAAVGAA